MSKRGFTLIELLVVLAIIGLIMSILLPSLGRARESGRTTQCLANQRTLAQAFFMYAGDEDDAIVCSWTDSRDHPASWVDWPRTATGGFLTAAQLALAESVESQIRGVRAGALYAYAQNHLAYHCPSDARDRVRSNPGSNLAWVTYSMPNYLAGDDGWEAQIGGSTRTARRLSQLSRTSDHVAFLEESDPRGLNMGSWVMRLNIPEWIDPLTVWHGDLGTIGFTDGHAAAQQWKDPRTRRMSAAQQFYASAVGNLDYQWFRERWWRR